MVPSPPPIAPKSEKSAWRQIPFSVWLLSTAIVLSGLLVFFGFWINSRSEKDRFYATSSSEQTYEIDRKTGDVWVMHPKRFQKIKLEE